MSMRRHDHARRAETALQRVMLAERSLQSGWSCLAARQPSMVVTCALGLNGQHQQLFNTKRAVDVDHTGAALTVSQPTWHR